MGLLRRGMVGLGLGVWAGLPAWAAEREPIYVLIDRGIEMPQGLLAGDQLKAGIQHDLALEIGRRLQREIRFRPLPRRRVEADLLAGVEADVACNYIPGWLPGPLLWSHVVMEAGDVLVTAARVRNPPRALSDLAGQIIGTVGGFRYPELESQLGVQFVRDDAPSLDVSFRKLAAGRMDHLVVGRFTLDYMRRRNTFPVAIHPPLTIDTVRTQCAVSPRGSLSLTDLNAAIDGMHGDGSMSRLLNAYR